MGVWRAALTSPLPPPRCRNDLRAPRPPPPCPRALRCDSLQRTPSHNHHLHHASDHRVHHQRHGGAAEDRQPDHRGGPEHHLQGVRRLLHVSREYGGGRSSDLDASQGPRARHVVERPHKSALTSHIGAAGGLLPCRARRLRKDSLSDSLNIVAGPTQPRTSRPRMPRP